jgi:hypothetical protein
LTTHSSTRETFNLEAPEKVVTRRRSKSLSFSQYEKYLTQLDPNLKQPKFLKESPPEPDAAPSLFSISTRRSFISIKQNFKSRVRWKKKATTFINCPMSVLPYVSVSEDCPPKTKHFS